MSKKIEAGDKVQLKSGGLEMVVHLINSNDEAECIWYENSHKKTDTFPLITLNKIDSPGIWFSTRKPRF